MTSPCFTYYNQISGERAGREREMDWAWVGLALTVIIIYS